MQWTRCFKGICTVCAGNLEIHLRYLICLVVPLLLAFYFETLFFFIVSMNYFRILTVILPQHSILQVTCSLKKAQVRMGDIML